jgi:putative endonuclease
MELSEAIERAGDRPATYVLNGRDGLYLYKGSCRDLRARLMDHLAGRVSRTKCRRPLEIVYFEYHDDYSTARKRELFLKTGVGRQWLKDRLSTARVVKWQTQET